jgi:hypothetical protein
MGSIELELGVLSKKFLDDRARSILPSFTPRRGLALLVFLLLEPGSGVERSGLPDSNPVAG